MEDLDFVVSSVPQNEEVLVFVFLRKERSQSRMNDAAKVRLLSARKTKHTGSKCGDQSKCVTQPTSAVGNGGGRGGVSAAKTTVTLSGRLLRLA